jgi:hypothetical protein
MLLNFLTSEMYGVTVFMCSLVLAYSGLCCIYGSWNFWVWSPIFRLEFLCSLVLVYFVCMWTYSCLLFIYIVPLYSAVVLWPAGENMLV